VPEEMRLNVRVPVTLLEQVKIECVKAHISVSDLVRDLLMAWLKSRQEQQK
jgi:Arc/MetJ-type ribon-helix-helix transcriptional regulator